MNKGLKNYTKQITKSLEGCGDIYVNINKKDANAHAVIPLLTSVGASPISTSLIFNYQDRNEIDIFGKGVKLNWFCSASNSYYGPMLKNADGSSDTFDYESGQHVNKERQLTMKIIPLGGYAPEYDFELYDKNGTTTKYEYNMLDYPKTITTKSGDCYTTDFIAAAPYISNGKGDKIVFTKDFGAFVSKVEWQKNGITQLAVDLMYKSDKLSKLTYKKGDVVLAETALSYSDNTIVLRDTKTNQCVRCDIESGRVVRMKDGHSSDFGATIDGGGITSVSYDNDEKTTITDENGNVLQIYFDKNSMPIFEMDSSGLIVKTAYDPNTKAIISQSTPIDTRKAGNTIDANGFNAVSNLTKTATTCTDSFFKQIVGAKTYRFEAKDNADNMKSTSLFSAQKGIATDSVTAIIWGKQLTPKTDKSGVGVTLKVGDETCSGIFGKTTIDDNFDVLVLGVNAKQNFSTIELKMDFFGNAAIEIGKIQIIQQEIGAYYKYGPSGNLEESIQGKNQSVVAYDKNNNPTEAVGTDGIEYNYEYDDYGNVIKTWGAYNVCVENEYDTSIKTNLKKQTVENITKDKRIVTSKEYDATTNAVSKEIDELGNATHFEYSPLGNVKKITDVMGVVTEFNYKNDAIIQDMLLKNGNVTEMSAHYDYDSANRITKITLANGSEYSFEYDTYGNIVKISLNGIAAYVFEYDATGKLISQAYGGGDKYVFGYEKGLLKTVSFIKAGTTDPVVKFKYQYDDRKRVSKVVEGENDTVLNEYTYDDNGCVSKQISAGFTIEKTYDSNGIVATQINKANDYSIYQSSEPAMHTKYSNTSSLLHPFRHTSYVGDFSRNAKLVYDEDSILPITHDGKTQRDLIFKREKNMRYVCVDKTHLLSYKPEHKFIQGFECGNVEFWFRQSKSEDAVLFSCKGTGKSYIEASIQQGHIIVNSTNINGQHLNTPLKSENTILENEWNFFALDFYYRDDGQGYTPDSRYRLTLNDQTKLTREIFYADVSGDPIYNIGHGFNESLDDKTFNGDIAFVRIFPRCYTDESKEKEFYQYTKKYMEGTIVPEINAVEKRSLTNSFALTQYEFSKYDIYPLQKNVVSLTGKKPESFELNKRWWWWSTSYKESVFEYDKDTKRYAYSSSNNTLSYKFGDVRKGTAIIRARSGKNGSVLGHIFECVDQNGNSLGLYCTANGNLRLNHNDTKFDTGLTLTPDKWHSIGLTFSELEVAESGGSSYFGNTSTSGIINRYLNIRVMLDDQCYTTSIKHDYVASLRTVTIGRPVTSKYSHIFDGLLEMLALGNDFIIQEDFKTIARKLDCTTRANTFDEFDILQSTEINKSGVCILANNLTYKSLNKTENGKSYKQLSPIVESEKISIGGAPLTTRTYTTDKLGRVTGISDGKFGNHSYEYDCRGFLVKDDNTPYQYDANGNVTKIGDTTLEYDKIVKDKLVKVGDKIVNYDANNPLVPTSYDGNTYTFEGRRLVRIQNENKSIAFEYNDQGLRIKKTVTESETSTVTKYFYDDNKLVAEISPSHRLDFLYDESSKLYGFVLDKTTPYYYVRDVLENILGIIDNSGNLVVQYAYNAWGKPVSTSGTLATTVGEYNPFRYKGYYFDKETGMYYCHTRYYVPEWCRWLNADHVAYIRFDCLDQSNLFVYCSNEPIGKIDKFGCSWNSFWSSVGKWFDKTFGGFFDVSEKFVSIINDHFFYGYEEGIEIGNSIGDSSKPISFYAKKASAWWRIWEYQVGIKVNIGNFGFSASIGVGEINFSASHNGRSVGVQCGVNKTGIEISHSNGNISQYHQYYIRTIPTLVAVCVAVYGLESLIVLVGFAI